MDSAQPSAREPLLARLGHVFKRRHAHPTDEPTDEPTEQEQVDQNAAEQKPAGEQPAGEQLAEEQPAEEQPTEVQPTEVQPAEEQRPEQPAAESKPEPLLARLGHAFKRHHAHPTEEPTKEEPVDQKTAEQKPAEQKPAGEQPAGEQPAGEQPTEEQPTEEQPTEEQPTEEQRPEQTAAEGKPEPLLARLGHAFKRHHAPERDEPRSADQPPVEPRTDAPPDEHDQPPSPERAEQQPAESKPEPLLARLGHVFRRHHPTSKDEQPSGEQPASEQPASEQPAGEQPAGDQPAGEQPAGEQPAEQQPAEQQPAEQQPAEQQPAAEQPVASPTSADEQQPAQAQTCACCSSAAEQTQACCSSEPAEKQPAQQQPAASPTSAEEQQPTQPCASKADTACCSSCGQASPTRTESPPQAAQHDVKSSARTVLVHDDAKNIEQLAETIASAFEDDPLIKYFHGEHIKPKRAHDKGLIWNRTVLHAELSRPKGQTTIHVTDDNSCVAIWHHPGHWKITGMYLAKFMVALVRTFGMRALLMASSMREVEHAHPAQPHMHLFIMGTHKEHQRKGYGSTVINEMLKYCDLERLPAYLESSNQLNLEFYHRHGFEMVQQIQPPRAGCPPIYTMWREPRPIQKQ